MIAVALTKDPDLASLYKCEQTNPHGGGVAWSENGYIHFKKGIKAEEMADLVANKPFPHIFHFRIASSGGGKNGSSVIPALCHPFTVKRKHNCDMEGVTKSDVLFHNGTIPEWKFLAQLSGIKYPDFASDTMVMARIISMRGESILTHLTAGSKFTVLHPDGQVKLYGGFTRIDGVEYSNSYWNVKVWRQDDYSNYHSHHQTCDIPEDDEEPSKRQCPECRGYNVDGDNSGQFLCNDCCHLWTVKLHLSVDTHTDTTSSQTPFGSPPNPGEGYRLIRDGELLERGDEWTNKTQSDRWSLTSMAGGKVGSVDGQFYRRKIQTPVPPVLTATDSLPTEATP